MGGTITVSSTYGEGSAFTLALPYQQSEELDRYEKELSHQTGDSLHAVKTYFSGKILLAEDTDVLQMLIQRMVEKLGNA